MPNMKKLLGMAKTWSWVLAAEMAVLAVPSAHANLLVTSFANNEVLQYDDSGTFVGVAITGISHPTGIAFGPDGDLYVATSSASCVSGKCSGSVYQYQYNGASSASLVSSFASGITDPTGIVFGPDGNLYVSSSTGNDVLKFNGPLNGAPGLLGNYAGISDPQGLAFGPDGNLYVANHSGTIEKLSGTTVGSILNPAYANGLSSPTGVTFGPDGNLYASFSTGSGSAVSKIGGPLNGSPGSALGNFVTSGSGSLSSPIGLVFYNGALYVVSKANSAVLKYDGTTGGFLGDFVGPGSGGLSSPQYLTFVPTPAPEPSTLALFGMGAGLLLLSRRKLRRS